MLWTTLLFIITISILVIVHEFGHYWVARRCGVKVERFSIGFGPVLCSYTTSQGTQFSLSAIPLGGYVKMLDSRVEELAEEDKKFAFDHKSIAQRAAIISAGPIANFILTFVVFWVIFQLGVVTYPPKIGRILPNSIAASVNIPSGSELKSIAGIKVEDWRDVQLALIGEIGEDSLTIEFLPSGYTTPVSMRLDIEHWRVDLDKENPITALGIEPLPPQILPVLRIVMPDSAAEKAGLQVGDKILQYNGKILDNWDDFVAVAQQGKQIKLVIERDGQRESVTLMPEMRLVDDATTGEQREVGFIGVVPDVDLVVQKYNVFSAVGKSLTQTGSLIKVTVRSFYQLITGAISLNNLSGPVSIAKSADQSASYGIVPYLHFLAFISVSLGVINLVPLPMLDGGHLLFLVVEKIKGSPLAESKQALFYRFGLLFLMLLMGVALFNDFSRL